CPRSAARAPPRSAAPSTCRSPTAPPATRTLARRHRDRAAQSPRRRCRRSWRCRKGKGGWSLFFTSPLWGGRSAKRIGWGAVFQRAKDPFNHTVDILDHFCIREAQRSIALRFEDAVAMIVVGSVFIPAMLGAIEFDHELRIVLDKIQRVAAERCLAP